MSWGRRKVAQNCRRLGNLPGEMSKKGFETGDLLSAFVKTGWSAMDQTGRLSAEFDLKEELTIGRVKSMAKTDCIAPHDSETSKHTPCFYNWFPKQMIGTCENWAFAQPVGDRCLVSYKSIYDNLGSLMEMNLVNANWNCLPSLWGQSTNGTAWVWKSLTINV